MKVSPTQPEPILHDQSTQNLSTPTKDQAHTNHEIPFHLKNNKLHLLATAINTSEPMKRTILETAAFNIPELVAAVISKRPTANLIEIITRAFYNNFVTIINPKLLSSVITNFGKMFTPEQQHKNLLNIARFQRNELEDLNSFAKGIARMKEEEACDQKLLANLAMNETDRIEKNRLAQEIHDFAQTFEANEKILATARKIKELAILGESFESIFWGFSPIFNNVVIRKWLLKQDGFTGLDEENRKKFTNYNPLQK